MDKKTRLDLVCPSYKTYLGFAEGERTLAQPISFRYQFHTNQDKAALTGDLADALDYVEILGVTQFIFWSARFHLIETAADVLSDYFLRCDHQAALIEKLQLEITKPTCLGGRAYPIYTIEKTTPGQQTSELDCTDCRIKIHHLSQARQFSNLPGTSFLVTQGTVETMGQTFQTGQAFVPPPQETLAIQGSGDKQSVLLEVQSKDPHANLDLAIRGLDPSHHFDLRTDEQSKILSVSFFDQVYQTYIKRS